MVSNKRLSLMAAILPCLLLPGCHPSVRPSPPQAVVGDVSYQAIADRSLGHYQLKMGQASIAPAPRANKPPRYPSAQIARQQPDVVISALLVVGADGRVHDVRFAPADATGAGAPFARAVAQAVLTWHFTPLRITSWEQLPNGGSKRVAAKAVPFSRRYRFRFAIVDGKPVVRAASDRRAAH